MELLHPRSRAISRVPLRRRRPRGHLRRQAATMLRARVVKRRGPPAQGEARRSHQQRVNRGDFNGSGGLVAGRGGLLGIAHRGLGREHCDRGRGRPTVASEGSFVRGSRFAGPRRPGDGPGSAGTQRSVCRNGFSRPAGGIPTSVAIVSAPDSFASGEPSAGPGDGRGPGTTRSRALPQGASTPWWPVSRAGARRGRGRRLSPSARASSRQAIRRAVPACTRATSWRLGTGRGRERVGPCASTPPRVLWFTDAACLAFTGSFRRRSGPRSRKQWIASAIVPTGRSRRAGRRRIRRYRQIPV